jgi:hypothetical protein
VALRQKRTVNLCVDSFPPLQFSPLLIKIFPGICRGGARGGGTIPTSLRYTVLIVGIRLLPGAVLFSKLQPLPFLFLLTHRTPTES